MITLLPLRPDEHAGLLQAVYRAVPCYWQMYGLNAAPAQQAARDLGEADSMPGRTILGILRPALDAAGAAEMVGMVDLRRDYPGPTIVTIGMFMVIEPLQRQGIGRAAWALLAPWLAEAAGMRTVRVAVEQFNSPALQFFSGLDFAVTGEAARTQVGDRFVRLLYMERRLAEPVNAEA